MLPLRQTTEFETLGEVVLGQTDKLAFPPKCKANANSTDHIEDLVPDFCANDCLICKKGDRL